MSAQGDVDESTRRALEKLYGNTTAEEATKTQSPHSNTDNSLSPAAASPKKHQKKRKQQDYAAWGDVAEEEDGKARRSGDTSSDATATAPKALKNQVAEPLLQSDADCEEKDTTRLLLSPDAANLKSKVQQRRKDDGIASEWSEITEDEWRLQRLRKKGKSKTDSVAIRKPSQPGEEEEPRDHDGFADDDSDIPDLDQIDPASLVKDETMELEKPLVDTAFLTSILGLVLSIATMMSAAQQFADGVSTKQIKDYGEEKFSTVVSVLTFFPMVYSPLLVLMYNSKRSKDVFHEYLQHGYLVDFPASGSIDFLVTHIMPILFLFVTLCYVAFSASIFVHFLAPSTIWLIFYKQLLFEIILVWMGIQTIEDNVITISEFVESFDDRSDDKKVDKYTTQRAAEMVINLRPARSRPSYKAYTDKYGVRRRSQRVRMLIRVGIIFGIGVLCVSTYYWFQFNAAGESKDTWQKQLNPCAQVCFDKSGRLPETCSNCMCDCATALGIKFNANDCSKYFAVPGCDQTDACRLESTGANACAAV